MNNDELNRLLRSASPPRREKTYWQEFPEKVLRNLRRQEVARPAAAPQPFFRWALVASLAACLVLGFWLGRQQPAPAGGVTASAPEAALAAARTYFREIEGLFPNQVRSIVLTEKGPQLVLSDRADIPRSAPVYLKVCSGRTCESFITFSGQEIQVDGKKYEILSGQDGQIILMGENAVWTSRNAAQAPTSLPFQVQAQPLENML